MKTRNSFVLVVAVTLLLFAPPFSSTTINSQEADPSDLIYEGGDIDEVTISCSSKPFGRCHAFEMRQTHTYGDVMEDKISFGCGFTGDMYDYCSWTVWMLFRAIDFWMPSYEE